MSGFAGLLLASGAQTFRVTIGNSGTNWGFADATLGPFGSVTPASFNGIAVGQMNSTDGVGGSDIFGLSLLALVPQSYFTSVMVEQSDGTFINYPTATASSYFQASGYSTWTWAQSPPPWTSANNGQTKSVMMRL